jgi:hypothetical protein
MTGSVKIPRDGAVIAIRGAYSSEDMARMQGAIDAVCGELGILRGPQRDAVARRIIAAYETGRRLPLNLVDAGLGPL